MSLEEFFGALRGRALPVAQALERYPVTLVHDTALPVLFGYHGLHEALQARRALFAPGLVAIAQPSHAGHPPEWVFYHYDGRYTYPWEMLVRSATRVRVASVERLAALEGSGVAGRPQREALWAMEEVFNPRNYKNKRSRYNALKAPLKLAANERIELVPLAQGALSAVQALHNRWVEAKLSAGAYRITFPTRRYYSVFEEWFRAYRRYGVFDAFMRLCIVGGRLYGAACTYIMKRDPSVVYDMALLTRYFEEGWHSQLTNAFQFLLFQELRDRGVKFINAGRFLDKGIEGFKMGWPVREVTYWEYTLGAVAQR